MVPSVRGPNRDEAEIHMAHLPVRRVLWRTGSDKGGKLQTQKNIHTKKKNLLSKCFYLLNSCITSLVTSWITLHRRATNVRLSLWKTQIHLTFFLNIYFLPSAYVESKPLAVLLGNLISHIFRENEVCRDAEWERYFCYRNIEVPEIYSGPHLTFPLTVEQAVGLVEAFRNKRVRARCAFSQTWLGFLKIDALQISNSPLTSLLSQ